ncbi:hypothetical protein SBRCBS47491_004483 [Sporothrix bragantina]|uniref:LysM domain protein n=1 Tax=Sporothrix bragantina TaxID=671064 RepID=A0ABP0BNN1_9PEZI
MAEANAYILAHPKYNVQSAVNSTTLAQSEKLAPYLPYGAAASNGSSTLQRRFLNQTATPASVNFTGNFTGASYRVPPEVVAAARIVAEAARSEAQHPVSAQDVVAQLQAVHQKTAPKTNDTNVMPQKMKRPSGLVQYVPPEDLAVRLQNGSAIADNTTEATESDSAASIAARDTTTYWQETMTQLGTSPYAPAGYKAISDGGRCGGGTCPSSSIYPATVYFPSGTYLVSGSIVQYYNTEILGNPISLPVIQAAASFVGLGVFSSDVYTGEKTEWYLNTNNFLRSIRNFIIDIRATPQDAQVCGIHWQVAQGSSLENIYFLQTDNNPATTQQGIYMENGSGGFLGSLYFSGGKFGAFMGNQQFTASGLLFYNCITGLQISWDWGWTMQNLNFVNAQTGVIIVGGAGGPLGTEQGVGSLALTDVVMENVKVGVETSLFADNSTSFFIQNSKFTNVSTIVHESQTNKVLYAGSSSPTAVITVPGWGFGRVTDASGNTNFYNGGTIPTPTRPTGLMTSGLAVGPQGFYFTRRRPSYADLGNSQLVDVKAWGAKGDGVTDDTAVLNFILSAAANISAVVYIPSGIYVITETLNVPVGSRIIGQAWPQIMASGTAFSDAQNPHVAVQVGFPGSVGAVEIQCIMFTVRGATAGAVLMEWNVHESTQGSAGLWDSHFRVGGAKGSNLQAADCPVTSQNKACIAASMLMHITTSASAYLENVWMWTADHDMDSTSQTQINVFAARGLLIESQGPTWLWGTAAEHCVLYQYQLTGAANVVLGLVQTESPYYQTVPQAPAPFGDSLVFANDPDFSSCAAGSKTCAMAWAVRVIDSASVFVLGTGLYTWFQDYDQTCINSGASNCQQSSFYIEQSADIWVFNLVTVGNIDMISPLNSAPVVAAANKNGYASSVLAWLQGANNTTGARNVTGYQLYTLEGLSAVRSGARLPDPCKTALTARIDCDDTTLKFLTPSYHGSLGNATLQNSVCAASCGQSLQAWYTAVNKQCAGRTWASGAPLAMSGGYIWYGYNETCQKESTAASAAYCTDVIDGFSLTDTLSDMPITELCSTCYLGRLQMMQASSYSIFNIDTFFQAALKAAVAQCSYKGPTSTPTVLIPVPSATPICVSGKHRTTVAGDTCDSIALAESVSTSSLFLGNQAALTTCSGTLAAGINLCIPLTCSTYQLSPGDTCLSASVSAGVDDITKFNSWINARCDNLYTANATMGSILCTSPLGGVWLPGKPTNTSSFPGSGNGTSVYGSTPVAPPVGANAAPNTTEYCAGWHVTVAGDTCASVTLDSGIALNLFWMANPSVNFTGDCTASLIVGAAYCVAPLVPPVLASGSSEYTTENYQYFGCFYSASPNGTGSGLDVILQAGDEFSSPIMTVRTCAEECLTSGGDYSFFGLTNQTDCICGNGISYNTSYAANMTSQTITSCGLPCAGNASETCGGPGSLTQVFGWDDDYPGDGGYPVSTDGLCGAASATNATCLGSGFGDCCGASGTCGSSNAFCNTNEGCQAGFGNCLTPISTDGKCGAASPTDATCLGSGFGDCCGASGTCGSTPAFCAGRLGCQSKYGYCKPISTDGKCGAASSVNAICLYSAFGDCCGANSTCGKTTAFCNTDESCQPDFGTCVNRVSTDGKCGAASSNDATCLGSAFGDCCGPSGTCGSTPAFCAGRLGCQSKYGYCKPISTDGKCGAASSVNAICLYSAFGDCCGANNTCGKTTAFCNTDEACQPDFGTCVNRVSTDGKCGAASANDATCLGSTFGQCCGSAGTCGSTPAFCYGRLGCQPKYGNCVPISTDVRQELVAPLLQPVTCPLGARQILEHV